MKYGHLKFISGNYNISLNFDLVNFAENSGIQFLPLENQDYFLFGNVQSDFFSFESFVRSVTNDFSLIIADEPGLAFTTGRCSSQKGMSVFFDEYPFWCKLYFSDLFPYVSSSFTSVFHVPFSYLFSFSQPLRKEFFQTYLQALKKQEREKVLTDLDIILSEIMKLHTHSPLGQISRFLVDALSFPETNSGQKVKFSFYFPIDRKTQWEQLKENLFYFFMKNRLNFYKCEMDITYTDRKKERLIYHQQNSGEDFISVIDHLLDMLQEEPMRRVEFFHLEFRFYPAVSNDGLFIVADKNQQLYSALDKIIDRYGKDKIHPLG